MSGISQVRCELGEYIADNGALMEADGYGLIDARTLPRCPLIASIGH